MEWDNGWMKTEQKKHNKRTSRKRDDGKPKIEMAPDFIYAV